MAPGPVSRSRAATIVRAARAMNVRVSSARKAAMPARSANPGPRAMRSVVASAPFAPVRPAVTMLRVKDVRSGLARLATPI
jgi:hypothetical protein